MPSSVKENSLPVGDDKFRTLVQLSPEAILIVQDGDGKIRYANPAAYDLLLPREDCLVGREYVEILGRPTIDGKPVLNSAPFWLTRELTRGDGISFEAEIATAPMTLQDRPAHQILIRDVTVTRTAEREQRLAAAIFQTTSEVMMVTDPQNRIIAVNPAFTRVTGYRPEDVYGKPPSILSSGHHDKDFYAALWRDLTRDGHWSGEISNRRKSGEVYIQRIAISEIRDPDGTVVNYIAVSSDITQERRRNDEMARRANTDVLTGLPNRALLFDRLERGIVNAEREGHELAVLFLDLDGFKPINDSFGHLVGDEVLQHVAARLREAIRANDTVARLGGDEFVIIAADLASPHLAERVGQKILRKLAQPFQFGAVRAHIGASIGISVFPHHGRTAEALLQAADRAMYEAKRRGKGRVAFATVSR